MASPPLVTVTGMVYETDGVTPYNGVIEFIQPVTLRHNDGTAILAGTLSAPVVDGVLARQIYTCDAEGWSPQGWTWELRIRAGSTWRTYTLLASVDDTDTVNLGDIIASDAEATGGLEYAPINHTHTDLGGGGGGAVDSVAGRTGDVVLTKADVGLPLVANVAPADLPVSSATQTALNLKAPLASPAFTGTPTGITKAHVGLGSVDNTSDAAKPISTATASALAAKADLVGGIIPTSQIPAVALVEFLGVVANQAAMLAKTGQPGDWVNRSDTGTSWQITGSNPAQLASWTELLYPASPVQSVAGRTGAVTLGKTDVGLGNVDNTADSAKAFTATQISNSTAVGRSVLTAADAAAARTAIGAAASGASPNPIILTEVALPSAPAADTASLYVRDVNGITEPEYQTSNGFIARLLRDNLAIAQNGTGVTITKGTPVYLTGVTNGTDGVPIVAPAQATTDASKLPCIAVSAQDIVASGYGRIMSLGRLDGINTAAYASGQRLFVSTVAGGLTNAYPATTVASQRVAVVGRSHATTGTLWVDVLTMIHDSAGTRRNTYAVGDGTAGAKSLQYVNAAGTHSLNANPTAARTWTLPDASVGVGSAPMVWNGSAFVEAPLGRVFVGGTVSPVGAPDGSVHIKEIP